jgi:hypothetical protein
MHPVAPSLFAAILLAGALPAWAQNEPFRIVNRTALPATALHVARSEGASGWGSDLLRGRPLAPGAFFAMRAPEGAGCRFDIRLVLQGGQELVLRGADVCEQRTVDMAGGPPPAPAAGPLPRVGGGQALMPAIQASPR